MMPVQLNTHKYSAQRTTCRFGHNHPSKREAARCEELCLLEKGGVIKDLKFQPRYKLEVNGKLICTYVGDWSFTENGELVTMDCKGVRTDVYRIKAKLFEAIYGRKIKET